MRNQGLLEVYYGNGKGKTTAALGLSLRSAGREKQVLILQFFKKRFTGELAALQCIPGITVFQFGSGNFILRNEPGEEDRIEFLTGWEIARKALISEQYSLVVLDELTYAFQYNLLSWQDCEFVLQKRLEQIEVVITGRNAPQPLLEMADLVTEMKMIKHPAERGVPAREGIEL